MLSKHYMLEKYNEYKLYNRPSNSRTAKYWLLSALVFVFKNMNNILKTHTLTCLINVHSRLVYSYVLSEYTRLLGS